MDPVNWDENLTLNLQTQQMWIVNFAQFSSFSLITPRNDFISIILITYHIHGNI